MPGWLAGWLADVASFRKFLGTSSGARPRARASGRTCPHSDNHAKLGNWEIGKVGKWEIENTLEIWKIEKGTKRS